MVPSWKFLKYGQEKANANSQVLSSFTMQVGTTGKESRKLLIFSVPACPSTKDLGDKGVPLALCVHIGVSIGQGQWVQGCWTQEAE